MLPPTFCMNITKTPTQALIDFVQSHINHPDYGAGCFGIVRRRTGDDLLAIYWPYLDRVNPTIADLWEAAETLVDAQTRASLEDKAMRQRFCRRADWAQYLEDRATGKTEAPPPWEGPQRNCHFYSLSAFGLSWDDFALYRAAPKPPKEAPPWTRIKYRTGTSRKDIVLMPVLLPPDEFDAIAERYPDKPVATTVWDMVCEALNNTPRDSLLIEGIERDIAFVVGGRTRFNISAPIKADDLLRDYANANEVPISTVIRSITNKNAYWQFAPAC
jgi:hypothetical protein